MGPVETEFYNRTGIVFNRYWHFILYVIQRLNRSRYVLKVGRTIRQKVCYVLTRSGIPTGFQFKEGSYGPYSEDVNKAVMALSNANLITEKSIGRMIVTMVNPSYVFPADEFTPEEISCADKAVDLLSRVKDTEQAEMVATVLFAYDELMAQKPSDYDVFQHILSWKKRWKGEKESEIVDTIFHLTSSGWINPAYSGKLEAQEFD